MSNENAILNHLFRHNLWANTEMLAACADLSPDQLATELSGTYGRLDHTLIHLARAQGGYLRRLTGWQPSADQHLDVELPFPGVQTVDAHLRFTGERLIEVAAEASADWQLEFEYEGPELEYKGQVERLPAWVVLLQAAHHATEHRQQIATILTNLGVEPPEPDLWAFWDTMAPSAGR